MHDTFAGLNVQVLGISIDHIPCLVAWAKSLGEINYPLLSDFWPHGAVAKEYGVFIKEGGITERAIFVLDKEGIIRYIDVHDIDEQPDNEVLLNELKKIIPDAEQKMSHLFKEQPKPEGDVVLYCTPWCPDCRRAREWLKNHEIEYSEVDISVNLNAARQVRSWGAGFQITPAFEINGEVVLDYDESKLAQMLVK